MALDKWKTLSRTIINRCVLKQDGATCGPRPAREEQIFSFKIGFLAGIWPSRKPKKAYYCQFEVTIVMGMNQRDLDVQ
jgi:hypothetical protein